MVPRIGNWQLSTAATAATAKMASVVEQGQKAARQRFRRGQDLMHLIRTVAPAVLPVSLAEVKAGANLDGSEDDAKIAGLIRTAVERSTGQTGRSSVSLITATWEMRMDCFPGFSFWPYRHSTRWEATFRPPYTEIEIPLPPLQAVDVNSRISLAATW